jgi:hypothetical protein
MGEELGRVLDPAALEACSKPRGRLAIEVPAAWAGGEIEIALPARVTCARCDGGGCDGCARRGGHRLEGDAAERTVRVRLPQSLDGGVVIRLVSPLGADEEGLAQLLLEARLGAASACVTFLPGSAMIPAPRVPRVTPMSPRAFAACVALALALVATLAIVTAR